MENCPYCSGTGNFYFNILSRTYHQCLKCDLIYKDIQEDYDKILTTYREDYFSKYSVDQTEGSRNSLFEHILGLTEKRREIGMFYTPS